MQDFKIKTLLEQNKRLAARADSALAARADLARKADAQGRLLALVKGVLAVYGVIWQALAQALGGAECGLSAEERSRLQDCGHWLAALLQLPQSEQAAKQLALQLEQNLPLILVPLHQGRVPCPSEQILPSPLIPRAIEAGELAAAESRTLRDKLELLQMRLRRIANPQAAAVSQMPDGHGCVCGGHRLEIISGPAQPQLAARQELDLTAILNPDIKEQEYKAQINRLVKQIAKMKKTQVVAGAQAKAGWTTDIYRSDQYRLLLEQASELLKDRKSIQKQLEDCRRLALEMQSKRTAEIIDLVRQVQHLREDSSQCHERSRRHHGLRINQSRGQQTDPQLQLVNTVCSCLATWTSLFQQFKALAYFKQEDEPKPVSKDSKDDGLHKRIRGVSEIDSELSSEGLKSATQAMQRLLVGVEGGAQCLAAITRQYGIQRTMLQRGEKQWRAEVQRLKKVQRQSDEQIRFKDKKLLQLTTKSNTLVGLTKRLEDDIDKVTRENILLSANLHHLLHQSLALKAGAEEVGQLQSNRTAWLTDLDQLRAEIGRLKQQIEQLLAWRRQAQQKIELALRQKQVAKDEALGLRTRVAALEQGIESMAQDHTRREQQRMEQERSRSNQKAQIQYLRSQLEQSRQVLLCCCCKQRQKSHLLTRCNHLLCSECANQLIKLRKRECPLCNMKLDKGDIRQIHLQ